MWTKIARQRRPTVDGSLIENCRGGNLLLNFLVCSVGEIIV